MINQWRMIKAAKINNIIMTIMIKDRCQFRRCMFFLDKPKVKRFEPLNRKRIEIRDICVNNPNEMRMRFPLVRVRHALEERVSDSTAALF